MQRFARAFPRLKAATLAGLLVCASAAHSRGLESVRFIVVDPVTGQPVSGYVTVVDGRGRQFLLATSSLRPGLTPELDSRAWSMAPVGPNSDATTITIPLGVSATFVQRDQVPTKEITIRVTATRLAPPPAPASTSSTTRNKSDLQKFNTGIGNDNKQLTKGQAGVAEDSAGQAHVRGEHSEISYVIDGVPLPDTLSGRQGSVVVTSTIQSIEMITGGFAPEFGGQTAAVLDITTLPSFGRARTDYSVQAGTYASLNSDITTVGPLGKKASYVIDLSETTTNDAEEPQQPDNQTAHNYGYSRSVFTKFRLSANSRDSLTLTMSNNPAALQVGNRTGLPDSFAGAGQGYGFEGLRDANGTIPGIPTNSPLLGAAPIILPSQQAAGMDINQDEINEFGTLSYVRKVNSRDTALLSATILHSGQEVTNHNPPIPEDLPVDNSIEYNPTAYRNAHHAQTTGEYDAIRGPHDLKAGFLLDFQSGHESYNIQSASQLALDALHALDPSLAPPGHTTGQKDVNGYPVFVATGPAPTLIVNRVGAYKAAYLQDTWRMGKLTLNYGLREDSYNQNQNLDQPSVAAVETSPRVNLDYKLDRLNDVRASYNHLFNTPPLAQGAIVGEAIQPEILNQYDLAGTHKFASNQALTVAYYYKQIHNQVDTGLLIPGSQIGLYSGVNFQIGAVHGLEVSYEISAPHGIGWDAYANWSHSAAEPSGLDNTGQPAPNYNDHDQRDTVDVGGAYTWRSGVTASATLYYGSGLASSIVPPSADRTPDTELDFHFSTGDRLWRGQGLALDILNVMDERSVINFDSGFSGTRFQQGRRVLLTFFGHF
jgi:outer membrane cobalamin receptor